jgi:FKBP-type peptidyl-prolyl cis-trans isomerase
MATNNKRREATRRQLEAQLRERQIREARRKRAILIGSISGTVVVIALVVILVIVFAGGSNKKTPAAASSAPKPTPSVSASPTTSSTAATAPVPVPKVACTKPSGKANASFDGVTVGGATNLKHEPKVASTSKTNPKALGCADLVVGKGAAATPTSTVKVQYTGVLYKNGKEFDSSWSRGTATSFPLTGVVPGFTQGIGGAGKVAPMRVGGRRIVILPPSLGYGAQASGSIPANSSLVFVIDLLKVTS